MHVHADPVSDAVGRPDLELHPARVGHQAQTHQTRFQHLVARRLDIARLRADSRGLLPGLLRRENDVEDVPLLARELAVDGIGAGDVARDALIVGGGVDEQEVARLHLAA